MRLILPLVLLMLFPNSSFCQSLPPDRSVEICSINIPAIDCFSTITGDTRNETNKIEANSYSNCLSPAILANNPFTGNDVVYTLNDFIFAGPPITFTLSSDKDLDLFIFECVDGVATCIAQNAGSTGYESLTINEWSDNYRIVIDAYNSSQNAPFELSVNCFIPCDYITYEGDCDLINYNYSGQNGSLTYAFSVPDNTEEGIWSIWEIVTEKFTPSLGTDKTISYTFGTSGGYEICYTYPDPYGCDIQCCKRIWIDDPTAGTTPASSPDCCVNEQATQNYLIEAFSKMCADCEVFLSCSNYNDEQAFQVFYPSGCLNPDADIITISFDCNGKVLGTELIPLRTWNSSIRNEVMASIIWSCGF